VKTTRSLDEWLCIRVSRRTFLGGSLALCTGACGRRSNPARTVDFTSTPFALGVASGDPTPDGVVLWSRLAPEPLTGGGMPPAPVTITWRVGRDEGMADVVQSGETVALPEWAHSVHVEVAGLDPDRWYWYQFRVGDQLSPVGRTRTVPQVGARVNRLRFAFASCQHYESGYFTAYRHMAAEDLDVVFHLGDYIYEGPGREGQVRMHTGREIMTIDDYRNRYALYRSDPDLQAAHAAFPWIVTWDDHEVDNDYAADRSVQDDPVELFLRRRAAAYRAYYEHMPLRSSAMPEGPSLQLYRHLAYGDLGGFFVLDTRQYRTKQPCGGGGRRPICDEALDPKATLLGAAQEQWLFGGLSRSSSRWNVIPQQVLIAKVDRVAGPEQGYAMDKWSGYEEGRNRMLSFVATRRPANPVVLTGDIHSNWVNDLKVDFADPRAPTVATELAGTSITSGGDGADLPETAAAMLSENPFVKFFNNQRGYVSCEMTPKTLRADYRVLEYVSRPGAPVRTRASFVIEDGKPGAQRV